MSEENRKYRLDHQPPLFQVDSIFLDFDLQEEGTNVSSNIVFRRDGGEKCDLVLDGEEMELSSISINEQELSADDYSINETSLTIPSTHLPDGTDTFTLQSKVLIHPEDNSALSGLYKSGSMFCTQCEAEGFRRITYFLDRPDVMTKYQVRVEGELEKYPVLLSNGNLMESGEVEGGESNRHFAIWEDPFKKPCYLFALVAGDLGSIHDTYTTGSGKEIKLGFYSEHPNVDKLDHALTSLKNAMRWDEETFGLECDLDMYNVVAVGDFNMGAMENKGLNIFNTACVLAHPQTSTDRDYSLVEGVIGHEYFHNWTGNRVTCKNWFQLTLKEGLTVYRDSRFSADMTDHVTKRIEDVKILRARQFPEDSGPTAHPIRPDSYLAMDNFYTLTVYEKGCEVIRMYQKLLGIDGFRKGMDLYFERHDGQAVTCDDFRSAMADANGRDLTQFELWYSQAGTPVLTVTDSYDETTKTFTLTLTQSLPTTPNQPGDEKKAQHIPIEICYFDGESGEELISPTLVELTEMTQEFSYENVSKKGVLSINRGFTAPIILEYERSPQELSTLLRVDDDGFNKWEYSQILATQCLMKIMVKGEDVESASSLFVEPLNEILTQTRAFVMDGVGDVNLSATAYCISLPDEITLSEEYVRANGGSGLDPTFIHTSRSSMKKFISGRFRNEFLEMYQKLQEEESAEYEYSSSAVGRRMLKNTCLGYLCSIEGDDELNQLAFDHFRNSKGMTDKLAGLNCLLSKEGENTKSALESFYQEAEGDELMVDKWFSIQAMSADTPNFEQVVQELFDHPAMTLNNPNRVRALLARFAIGNPSQFHSDSGWGYQLVGEKVQALDEINPQMASRIVQCFAQWKKCKPNLGELQRSELQRLSQIEGLSKNTKEMVDTCLGEEEEKTEEEKKED